MGERIKKIFLEDLPRKEGLGILKGKQVIDWSKSITHKVKGIYDDIEFEVEIVNYVSKGQFLYIKYLDKDVFKMKTGHFQNCQFGKLLEKITGEYKVEIGTVFKDKKRDFIITNTEYRSDNRKENQKWYKYKCNKCGWTEGWITEGNLLNGNGCSCCNGKTIVEGINDIPTTAPWIVKFFQGGYDEAKMYTRSSHIGITPICPDCGRIKDKEMSISKVYKKQSIGCSCSDSKSYPEKFMFNVLEQLGIDFISEYNPDWIKPKRYDFYFELDNEEYIIETDGELGHGKETHNLSNKSSEETKAEDDYKDRLADEHNIEVIRIDCDKSELEYIKNKITDSRLNELFDLGNIDWLKCEEFALNNLVKMVCEIKRDNPNMTTGDISKITQLCKNTIASYLKRGSIIWSWVNYNPKEERSKSATKSRDFLKKQVEVFKDGISLGIFKSAKEIDNRSEELFGVKLYSPNISSVCNNKLPHYKKFIFKFV